ncbi:MAG TPA: hypothetical protein VGH29_02865 [Candidatus Binataceae bacterium]
MSKNEALRTMVRASIAQPDLPGRLERHRDFHFRRLPARRVKSESQALSFINEVGFCTAFSAGLNLPCLREAIVGEREPPLPHHIQHDYAIGMTWRLKDVLSAKRAVYYGKAIAGRPAFIAPQMLPAFLCLRASRTSYLSAFRRGELSLCGKLVMDALRRRAVAATAELKVASGYARASRRAEFDRAMKELQEKFMVLKVEERYEPFTYVWSTLEHRWADAAAQARELRREEAAYQIIKRYFLIAGYGAQRAIGRALGIEPKLAGRAMTRLVREGFLAPATPASALPRGCHALTEPHLYA